MCAECDCASVFCRLRDVLFLDLALELAGRGALEAGLAAIRAAAPSTLLGGLLALLQQPLASACMSALPGQGGNASLVAVAGQLNMLSQDCPGMFRTLYELSCAVSGMQHRHTLRTGCTIHSCINCRKQTMCF